MIPVEPYGWCQALERFADNVPGVLSSSLKILDAAEMLFVRVFIFAGFLYGLYVLARRREGGAKRGGPET